MKNSTTLFCIKDGCQIGNKDNIAPIKAVRFFIKKLLLKNIPTVEKINILRFLLRDGEKMPRETHVKPIFFYFK